MIFDPSDWLTSIVRLTSSDSNKLYIFVRPLHSIENIIALWDIDLSPGTMTVPDIVLVGLAIKVKLLIQEMSNVLIM